MLPESSENDIDVDIERGMINMSISAAARRRMSQSLESPQVSEESISLQLIYGIPKVAPR
jgi:hypothetical protein